ncbi:hypothetical protein D0869_09523 [Hortaea werneckii]|uniref:Uncharacterized protein n=1 Tax=Hortaea werneckii TaxID=91943 RepID=A0A3M6WH58_HORWE|nr:hypothetical protein KC324_g9246 [Hortaea werneckii]KAI7574328.1 hypothetical protein KC316_g11543 [Hortaea werneckii]RMX77893.1 hypothetical protein D0869_09523 [Hortaea werneckii]RMX94809.1 hypothetical protein D0868_12087 [Hortaea werneckii]
MSSLRLLPPRATLQLHSRQLQHRLLFPSLRHSSTSPPPKPRVLEKPERFNPPSHPSRLRSRGPKYYGPALSDREREMQKTKRYPHMMPPEGSFMHWFLTDRTIHLWITITILVFLTFSIWLQDFLAKTPYRDLLPPNSMLFSHPITFFGRWAEVYEMHVAYTSAETAERRKAKMDDVAKRSEFRKAHGIESNESGVFGGWTAKPDEDSLEPADREGGRAAAVAPDTDASPVATEVKEAVAAADDGSFVDFEGKTQPAKKKWFGIW